MIIGVELADTLSLLQKYSNYNYVGMFYGLMRIIMDRNMHRIL